MWQNPCLCPKSVGAKSSSWLEISLFENQCLCGWCVKCSLKEKKNNNVEIVKKSVDKQSFVVIRLACTFEELKKISSSAEIFLNFIDALFYYIWAVFMSRGNENIAGYSRGKPFQTHFGSLKRTMQIAWHFRSLLKTVKSLRIQTNIVFWLNWLYFSLPLTIIWCFFWHQL